jgi:adenylate kinase
MSQSKPFKTVVAFFTAFIFFITSLGISPNAFAAASMPEVSLPYQAAIDRNLRIAIPQELGKLENFNAGSGPAIFHIQTAHGSYQAQQQIRAILHHLEKSYGVKTLLVEGSATELRTDVLNFFPTDKKLTMKIADTLTKHALVTGEELFLLDEVQREKRGLVNTRNQVESRVPSPESRALGIENLKSYLSNGESFAATLRQKEKTDQFLRDMNEGIERIQSAYLNDTLRGFLKRLEAYEKNLTPIDAWLNYMKGEALKHLRLDLTDPGAQIDWPMMIRIFKVQELSAKLDRKAFPKERDEFLKAIKRFLPGNGERGTQNGTLTVTRSPFAAIESLLRNDSMSQPLSDPETSLLFEDMVRQLPPNFNYDAFPNVRYFIGLLLLQSELKAERLMKEAGALSEKILAKLAKTEIEKTLVGLLKDYRLLQKLFALELTPDDYEAIAGERLTANGERKNIKPSEIVRRFSGIVFRSPFPVSRVKPVQFTHIADLDQLFDLAMKFYEGAKTRDAEMMQGVERRIKETGATKVAVITGGFHAGPFKEYFSAKDYNYMLISPRITSVDDAGKLDYVRTVMASFTQYSDGGGRMEDGANRSSPSAIRHPPSSSVATYLLRALQPVEGQPVSSRIVNRVVDVARAEVRDSKKLERVRATLTGKLPARDLPGELPKVKDESASMRDRLIGEAATQAGMILQTRADTPQKLDGRSEARGKAVSQLSSEELGGRIARDLLAKVTPDVEFLRGALLRNQGLPSVNTEYFDVAQQIYQTLLSEADFDEAEADSFFAEHRDVIVAALPRSELRMWIEAAVAVGVIAVVAGPVLRMIRNARVDAETEYPRATRAIRKKIETAMHRNPAYSGFVVEHILWEKLGLELLEDLEVLLAQGSPSMLNEEVRLVPERRGPIVLADYQAARDQVRMNGGDAVMIENAHIDAPRVRVNLNIFAANPRAEVRLTEAQRKVGLAPLLAGLMTPFAAFAGTFDSQVDNFLSYCIDQHPVALLIYLALVVFIVRSLIRTNKRSSLNRYRRSVSPEDPMRRQQILDGVLKQMQSYLEKISAVEKNIKARLAALAAIQSQQEEQPGKGKRKIELSADPEILLWREEELQILLARFNVPRFRELFLKAAMAATESRSNDLIAAFQKNRYLMKVRQAYAPVKDSRSSVSYGVAPRPEVPDLVSSPRLSEETEFQRLVRQSREPERANERSGRLSGVDEAAVEIRAQEDFDAAILEMFGDIPFHETADARKGMVSFLGTIALERLEYSVYVRQAAVTALRKIGGSDSLAMAAQAMEDPDMLSREVRLPEKCSRREAIDRIVEGMTWVLGREAVREQYSGVHERIRRLFRDNAGMLSFLKKYPLRLFSIRDKPKIDSIILGDFRRYWFNVVGIIHFQSENGWDRSTLHEVKRTIEIRARETPVDMGLAVEIFKNQFLLSGVVRHEYLHYTGVLSEGVVLLRQINFMKTLLVRATVFMAEKKREAVERELVSVMQQMGILSFANYFVPSGDNEYLAGLNANLLRVYGPDHMSSAQIEAESAKIVGSISKFIEDRNRELSAERLLDPSKTLYEPLSEGDKDRIRTLVRETRSIRNTLTPDEFGEIMTETSAARVWEAYVARGGGSSFAAAARNLWGLRPGVMQGQHASDSHRSEAREMNRRLMMLACVGLFAITAPSARGDSWDEWDEWDMGNALSLDATKPINVWNTTLPWAAGLSQSTNAPSSLEIESSQAAHAAEVQKMNEKITVAVSTGRKIFVTLTIVGLGVGLGEWMNTKSRNRSNRSEARSSASSPSRAESRDSAIPGPARGLRPLFMAGLVTLASFWMTVVATAQTVFPGKPRLEKYDFGFTSASMTQFNSSLFRWDFSISGENYNSYSIAVINFVAGGGARDLSGYQYLDFLMRGYNSAYYSTGEGFASIEFKDTSGHVVYSGAHNIGSQDYELVRFDRQASAAQYPAMDWRNIKEIVFKTPTANFPYSFNGWFEIQTGGLYFFTPPIAPDPNLSPYDTTALSAAGPVWPTVVKPSGATAIATPTERGASFFLRTYGGSDNWAGGGFTFDNPATPQVETGNMSGFANQVYTLYGGHSGVKMEVVDAAENKESVQLISIDASQKTWAIPANSFASVDLGRVKVIYFIVEGFYRTGTLNVDHIPQSLVMSGVTYSNGTAQVSFPSYAGANYKIEYRNDLTSGDWLEAETITATGSQTTWIDNGSKTGAPSSKRFYRVVYLSRSEVRNIRFAGDEVNGTPVLSAGDKKIELTSKQGVLAGLAAWQNEGILSKEISIDAEPPITDSRRRAKLQKDIDAHITLRLPDGSVPRSGPGIRYVFWDDPVDMAFVLQQFTDSLQRAEARASFSGEEWALLGHMAFEGSPQAQQILRDMAWPGNNTSATVGKGLSLFYGDRAAQDIARARKTFSEDPRSQASRSEARTGKVSVAKHAMSPDEKSEFIEDIRLLEESLANGSTKHELVEIVWTRFVMGEITVAQVKASLWDVVQRIYGTEFMSIDGKNERVLDAMDKLGLDVKPSFVPVVRRLEKLAVTHKEKDLTDSLGGNFLQLWLGETGDEDVDLYPAWTETSLDDGVSQVLTKLGNASPVFKQLPEVQKLEARLKEIRLRAEGSIFRSEVRLNKTGDKGSSANKAAAEARGNDSEKRSGALVPKTYDPLTKFSLWLAGMGALSLLSGWMFSLIFRSIFYISDAFSENFGASMVLAYSVMFLGGSGALMFWLTKWLIRPSGPGSFIDTANHFAQLARESAFVRTASLRSAGQAGPAREERIAQIQKQLTDLSRELVPLEMERQEREARLQAGVEQGALAPGKVEKQAPILPGSVSSRLSELNAEIDALTEEWTDLLSQSGITYREMTDAEIQARKETGVPFDDRLDGAMIGEIIADWQSGKPLTYEGLVKRWKKWLTSDERRQTPRRESEARESAWRVAGRLLAGSAVSALGTAATAHFLGKMEVVSEQAPSHIFAVIIPFAACAFVGLLGLNEVFLVVGRWFGQTSRAKVRHEVAAKKLVTSDQEAATKIRSEARGIYARNAQREARNESLSEKGRSEARLQQASDRQARAVKWLPLVMATWMLAVTAPLLNGQDLWTEGSSPLSLDWTEPINFYNTLFPARQPWLDDGSQKVAVNETNVVQMIRSLNDMQPSGRVSQSLEILNQLGERKEAGSRVVEERILLEVLGPLLKDGSLADSFYELDALKILAARHPDGAVRASAALKSEVFEREERISDIFREILAVAVCVFLIAVIILKEIGNRFEAHKQQAIFKRPESSGPNSAASNVSGASRPAPAPGSIGTSDISGRSEARGMLKGSTAALNRTTVNAEILGDTISQGLLGVNHAADRRYGYVEDDLQKIIDRSGKDLLIKTIATGFLGLCHAVRFRYGYVEDDLQKIIDDSKDDPLVNTIATGFLGLCHAAHRRYGYVEDDLQKIIDNSKDDPLVNTVAIGFLLLTKHFPGWIDMKDLMAYFEKAQAQVEAAPSDKTPDRDERETGRRPAGKSKDVRSKSRTVQPVFSRRTGLGPTMRNGTDTILKDLTDGKLLTGEAVVTFLEQLLQLAPEDVSAQIQKHRGFRLECDQHGQYDGIRSAPRRYIGDFNWYERTDRFRPYPEEDWQRELRNVLNTNPKGSRYEISFRLTSSNLRSEADGVMLSVTLRPSGSGNARGKQSGSGNRSSLRPGKARSEVREGKEYWQQVIGRALENTRKKIKPITLEAGDDGVGASLLVVSAGLVEKGLESLLRLVERGRITTDEQFEWFVGNYSAPGLDHSGMNTRLHVEWAVKAAQREMDAMLQRNGKDVNAIVLERLTPEFVAGVNTDYSVRKAKKLWSRFAAAKPELFGVDHVWEKIDDAFAQRVINEFDQFQKDAALKVRADAVRPMFAVALGAMVFGEAMLFYEPLALGFILSIFGLLGSLFRVIFFAYDEAHPIKEVLIELRGDLYNRQAVPRRIASQKSAAHVAEVAGGLEEELLTEEIVEATATAKEQASGGAHRSEAQGINARNAQRDARNESLSETGRSEARSIEAVLQHLGSMPISSLIWFSLGIVAALVSVSFLAFAPHAPKLEEEYRQELDLLENKLGEAGINLTSFNWSIQDLSPSMEGTLTQGPISDVGLFFGVRFGPAIYIEPKTLDQIREARQRGDDFDIRVLIGKGSGLYLYKIWLPTSVGVIRIEVAPTRSEARLSEKEEGQFQKALRDLPHRWWDGKRNQNGVERRAAAAKSLGGFKDSRAVLPLFKLLTEESATLRIAAASGLLQLEDKRLLGVERYLRWIKHSMGRYNILDVQFLELVRASLEQGKAVHVIYESIPAATVPDYPFAGSAVLNMTLAPLARSETRGIANIVRGMDEPSALKAGMLLQSRLGYAETERYADVALVTKDSRYFLKRLKGETQVASHGPLSLYLKEYPAFWTLEVRSTGSGQVRSTSSGQDRSGSESILEITIGDDESVAKKVAAHPAVRESLFEFLGDPADWVGTAQEVQHVQWVVRLVRDVVKSLTVTESMPLQGQDHSVSVAGHLSILSGHNGILHTSLQRSEARGKEEDFEQDDEEAATGDMAVSTEVDELLGELQAVADETEDTFGDVRAGAVRQVEGLKAARNKGAVQAAMAGARGFLGSSLADSRSEVRGEFLDGAKGPVLVADVAGDPAEAAAAVEDAKKRQLAVFREASRQASSGIALDRLLPLENQRRKRGVMIGEMLLLTLLAPVALGLAVMVDGFTAGDEEDRAKGKRPVAIVHSKSAAVSSVRSAATALQKKPGEPASPQKGRAETREADADVSVIKEIEPFIDALVFHLKFEAQYNLEEPVSFETLLDLMDEFLKPKDRRKISHPIFENSGFEFFHAGAAIDQAVKAGHTRVDLVNSLKDLVRRKLWPTDKIVDFRPKTVLVNGGENRILQISEKLFFRSVYEVLAEGPKEKGNFIELFDDSGKVLWRAYSSHDRDGYHSANEYIPVEFDPAQKTLILQHTANADLTLTVVISGQPWHSKSGKQLIHTVEAPVADPRWGEMENVPANVDLLMKVLGSEQCSLNSRALAAWKLGQLNHREAAPLLKAVFRKYDSVLNPGSDGKRPFLDDKSGEAAFIGSLQSLGEIDERRRVVTGLRDACFHAFNQVDKTKTGDIRSPTLRSETRMFRDGATEETLLKIPLRLDDKGGFNHFVGGLKEFEQTFRNVRLDTASTAEGQGWVVTVSVYDSEIEGKAIGHGMHKNASATAWWRLELAKAALQTLEPKIREVLSDGFDVRTALTPVDTELNGNKGKAVSLTVFRALSTAAVKQEGEQNALAGEGAPGAATGGYAPIFGEKWPLQFWVGSVAMVLGGVAWLAAPYLFHAMGIVAVLGAIAFAARLFQRKKHQSVVKGQPANGPVTTGDVVRFIPSAVGVVLLCIAIVLSIPGMFLTDKPGFAWKQNLFLYSVGGVAVLLCLFPIPTISVAVLAALIYGLYKRVSGRHKKPRLPAMKAHRPVVVLVAKAGAGKGTVSGKLLENSDMIHISTGDLLAEAVEKKTPAGVEAKAFMARGELVPDAIMIKVLEDEFTNSKHNGRGFVFDGFPRNVAQAEALDAFLTRLGFSIDLVLHIDISDEEVVRRLGTRWMCPKCRATYNNNYIQPKVDGVCDHDGTKLVQRKDDTTPEAVLNRLGMADKNFPAILAHYKKQGKLVTVNAELGSEAIAQALIESYRANRSFAGGESVHRSEIRLPDESASGGEARKEAATYRISVGRERAEFTVEIVDRDEAAVVSVPGKSYQWQKDEMIVDYKGRIYFGKFKFGEQEILVLYDPKPGVVKANRWAIKGVTEENEFVGIEVTPEILDAVETFKCSKRAADRDVESSVPELVPEVSKAPETAAAAKRSLRQEFDRFEILGFSVIVSTNIIGKNEVVVEGGSQPTAAQMTEIQAEVARRVASNDAVRVAKKKAVEALRPPVTHAGSTPAAFTAPAKRPLVHLGNMLAGAFGVKVSLDPADAENPVIEFLKDPKPTEEQMPEVERAVKAWFDRKIAERRAAAQSQTSVSTPAVTVEPVILGKVPGSDFTVEILYTPGLEPYSKAQDPRRFSLRAQQTPKQKEQAKKEGRPEPSRSDLKDVVSDIQAWINGDPMLKARVDVAVRTADMEYAHQIKEVEAQALAKAAAKAVKPEGEAARPESMAEWSARLEAQGDFWVENADKYVEGLFGKDFKDAAKRENASRAWKAFFEKNPHLVGVREANGAQTGETKHGDLKDILAGVRDILSQQKTFKVLTLAAAGMVLLFSVMGRLFSVKAAIGFFMVSFISAAGVTLWTSRTRDELLRTGEFRSLKLVESVLEKEIHRREADAKEKQKALAARYDQGNGNTKASMNGRSELRDFVLGDVETLRDHKNIALSLKFSISGRSGVPNAQHLHIPGPQQVALFRGLDTLQDYDYVLAGVEDNVFFSVRFDADGKISSWQRLKDWERVAKNKNYPGVAKALESILNLAQNQNLSLNDAANEYSRFLKARSVAASLSWEKVAAAGAIFVLGIATLGFVSGPLVLVGGGVAMVAFLFGGFQAYKIFHFRVPIQAGESERLEAEALEPAPTPVAQEIMWDRKDLLFLAPAFSVDERIAAMERIVEESLAVEVREAAFKWVMWDLLRSLLPESGSEEFRSLARPIVKSYLSQTIGTDAGRQKVKELAVTSEIEELELLTNLLREMNASQLLSEMAENQRVRSELRGIALDKNLPVEARIRLVRGAFRNKGDRPLFRQAQVEPSVSLEGVGRGSRIVRAEMRANVIPAKTLEELMTPESLKLIEEYYFNIIPARMMERLLEVNGKSALVTALQRLLGVPLSYAAGDAPYTTVLSSLTPGKETLYVPGILVMGGITATETSVQKATNIRGALAIGQDLLNEFLSQNPRALYYLLKTFMTETGVPSLVTVGSPDLLSAIKQELTKKDVVPAAEFESLGKVLDALKNNRLLKVEPMKSALGEKTEAAVLNRLGLSNQGGLATLHLGTAQMAGLTEGVHFAFGENIGSEDLMVASVLAMVLKSVADLIRNVPDDKLCAALLEAFVARNLPGVQKSGANAFVIAHLAQLAQEFVKQSLIAKSA